MAKRKKKLKVKKKILFQAISLFLTLFSLVIFFMFLKLDILPFSILSLIFGGLLFIDFFVYILLTRKNYRLRMLGTVLSIFVCILFLFLWHYQSTTISFLKQIHFLNIETENYEVLVHKVSEYHDLEDLQAKTLAFVNDRKGVEKVWKELKKEQGMKENLFEEASSLMQSLLEQNVDAILMEEEELNLYYEMSPEFKENTRVLKTISVDVQSEMVDKNIEITKEPFHVYVTGIDTYGKISKVSRSDVNMIITVNPITHRVLLTSVPRDYYVDIYGSESDLKDKLTHAGLKGVNTSVKTLENLFDIEIPYFVKINFTSLVDVVDAVKGLDVENPFDFTAKYQEENGDYVYYKFAKGNIHLTGKEALAFVRERYGLREGDVARARHQQQVIKALVDKVTSPTILTQYSSILGSLEGNFNTNISLSNITGFVEKQLEKNPSWTIESQVLTGIDSSEKTASFPDLYSYVMLPDEEVVENAKAKMYDVFHNE